MGQVNTGSGLAPAPPPSSGPELLLQNAHSDQVRGLAFSPDGRVLASASDDSTVKLWEVESGALLRTLRGHSERVESIAFDADGRRLVSLGADRALKLWDVEHGKLLRSLEADEGLLHVAFSPDGRTLVSSGRQLIVRWDAGTLTLLGRQRIESGSLSSIAFSADGQLLATAGDHIRLWESATGKPGPVLDQAADCLAFAPDGRLLSAAQNVVSTWDPARARLVSQLNLATGAPCAFDPPASALAWVGKDKKIQLWDITRQSARHVYAGHGGRFGWVHALRFSPEGGLLASAGEDRAVKLWRTGQDGLWRSLESHSDPIEAVSFSPDGRTLAAGGQGRAASVDLWDSGGGALSRRLVGTEPPTLPPGPEEEKAASMLEESLRKLDGASFKITGVETKWEGSRPLGTALAKVMAGYAANLRPLAYSPDGSRLAAGTLTRYIDLWEPNNGARIRTLTAHEGAVRSIAFAPDGRWFVSGGEDRIIKIWDARTQYVLHELADAHTKPIVSLAISPDGRLLASSGNRDRDIKVWATNDWKLLFRLADAGSSYGLAFSPNSRWLVAGDDELRVWDMTSGKLARELTGKSGGATCIAFSPDGQTLAYGTQQMTIALWDFPLGKLKRTLAGHTGPVWSVSFSPDGKLLASGSDDTSVALWEVESGRLLATASSFNQGQEWLVTAPDGLFDGSPGAFSRVRWRFSDRLFDTAPVELFFNEFYRPGLLAEVLRGERPTAPRDIEQLDRRQPQVSLVRAASPGAAASVAGSTVSLRVEVAEVPADRDHAAGSGARDVRLFRNGALVKAWRGSVLPAGAGKVALETTIPIVAGENRLTAYAFNRDNVKSPDAQLVVLGSEARRHKGTLYILAVGIDKYANPDYHLQFAVADAQAFAAELGQRQSALKLFDRVEVVSILNADATKASILGALQQLSRQDQQAPPGASPGVSTALKPAEPEDTVVIYYAGHGTASGPRFYLIPHDLGYAGKRAELEQDGLQTILQHSISDRELERALERVDAGRLLLIVDACNSGQALEAEEKRRGPMNSRGLAQLAYEKGMYILTAAQGYQAALEAAQLGHGYLTFALVEEGLKTAAADRDPRDGKVVLREWLDYATLRVPQLQQALMAGAHKSGRELAMVQGDEGIADPAKRSLQRPRIFYRREPERDPLVVSKP